MPVVITVHHVCSCIQRQANVAMVLCRSVHLHLQCYGNVWLMIVRDSILPVQMLTDQDVEGAQIRYADSASICSRAMSANRVSPDL